MAYASENKKPGRLPGSSSEKFGMISLKKMTYGFETAGFASKRQIVAKSSYIFMAT